ncbi:hypothetical protein CF319_g1072 [Tilletia indica]|nr:hypothetical protein CF319_g1072 [Tilletia indica]
MPFSLASGVASGSGETTTITIAHPAHGGNNDDAESVISHHQPGPPAPPPLLLPPPAFATVAPDIYRCSSSFPTPHDIANVSVRDTRSQQQSQQQQHPSTAQGLGSSMAPTITANETIGPENKDPASSSSHTPLASSNLNPSTSSATVAPGTTGAKPTPSRTSSSSSSPFRSPALSIPSTTLQSQSQGPAQGSSTAVTPTPSSSRPRSRVNSSTSSSAPHAHHQHHPRARHISALASAAALYAPFLDSLQLRTVLVLGWERPSKTLQRYCRDRGISIVHLGLDGSRIGPPSAPAVGSGRKGTTVEKGGLSAEQSGSEGGAASNKPGSLHGQRSPVSSAASSTSTTETGGLPSSSHLGSSMFDTSKQIAPPPRPSSASSSMTSGSAPYPLHGAVPPPPIASTSSPALSSSASSSSSISYSPNPSAIPTLLSPGLGLTEVGALGITASFGSHPATQITAAAVAAATGASSTGTSMLHAKSGFAGTTGVMGCGTSTVTGSLFAASASQAGFISERMVKDGLEIILDKQNHPVMIMDTSGIQETGVLVGCLRRMQRWDFASILVEYRSFAGTRSRVVNERFIEMYDTDLTTLPPMHDLPPFFAEHLAMDEEELDRRYGF